MKQCLIDMIWIVNVRNNYLYTFVVTAWETTILVFSPSFNVGMMHRQSVNSIYNIEPGGGGGGEERCGSKYIEEDLLDMKGVLIMTAHHDMFSIKLIKFIFFNQISNI